MIRDFREQQEAEADGASEGKQPGPEGDRPGPGGADGGA